MRAVERESGRRAESGGRTEEILEGDFKGDSKSDSKNNVGKVLGHYWLQLLFVSFDAIYNYYLYHPFC